MIRRCVPNMPKSLLTPVQRCREDAHGAAFTTLRFGPGVRQCRKGLSGDTTEQLLQVHA